MILIAGQEEVIIEARITCFYSWHVFKVNFIFSTFDYIEAVVAQGRKGVTRTQRLGVDPHSRLNYLYLYIL